MLLLLSEWVCGPSEGSNYRRTGSYPYPGVVLIRWRGSVVALPAFTGRSVRTPEGVRSPHGCYAPHLAASFPVASGRTELRGEPTPRCVAVPPPPLHQPGRGAPGSRCLRLIRGRCADYTARSRVTPILRSIDGSVPIDVARTVAGTGA